MKVDKCRVCTNPFFGKPLLVFNNMPKTAQYLPKTVDLKNERGVQLEVFQCSGCGLVQIGNKPVSYYKEVIRAAGVSAKMKDFRRRQLLGFIKKFSLKGKKIIEIGCGSGEYLSIINGLGVTAYGVEHSVEAVRSCRKKGLRVFKSFAAGSARLPQGPFDAFLMFSFLEHLPEPNLALRGIFNNLKEEGVGIVEVPNFDMIARTGLFSEFMTDHQIYFTQDTIRLALSINGFEVLQCREIWDGYIISCIVRKKNKSDFSFFLGRQKKVCAGINRCLVALRGKRVAVWGAGHQALAVISLAGLSDKIKYVVDSAPFKQGRFTPASHIPIVHPSRLKIDPVDAVIVMAAAYSKEVAGIIKRDFKDKIKIFILKDYGLEAV
jgi:SAM-dependent methyltransferase